MHRNVPIRLQYFEFTTGLMPKEPWLERALTDQEELGSDLSYIQMFLSLLRYKVIGKNLEPTDLLLFGVNTLIKEKNLS